MLDKKGYVHARACTCPRAWAHARTLAHTNMQRLLLFHGNNDLECASVMRYAYIACLVSLSLKMKYVVHHHISEFEQYFKAFIGYNHGHISTTYFMFGSKNFKTEKLGFIVSFMLK
jgi:hypothetical protein